MDIIASYGTVLILIAAAVGFFMAYGIGANDVANNVGPAVGSKASPGTMRKCSFELQSCVDSGNVWKFSKC